MLQSPIQPQVEIQTARLTLRPLRASDAGLIGVYCADKRVASMTRSIPHPFPPGATEAFIAQALKEERTEDIWALDGSEHGHAEVIGLLTLNRMDRGQSEISYWVAPAFWNTGFASEAVEAVLQANPHANSRIFGEVFQDNPGSAKVLTKAGFEYLGDAEAFSVARDSIVQTWTYSKSLAVT
jgi:RimJ/RimL family protein N-acetyltransferase